MNPLICEACVTKDMTAAVTYCLVDMEPSRWLLEDLHKGPDEFYETHVGGVFLYDQGAVSVEYTNPAHVAYYDAVKEFLVHDNRRRPNRRDYYVLCVGDVEHTNLIMAELTPCYIYTIKRHSVVPITGTDGNTVSVAVVRKADIQ